MNVETSRPTLRDVLLPPVAGERNETRAMACLLFAHAARDLETIHDREAEIQNRSVRREYQQTAQRFRSVLGHLNLMAQCAEELRDHFPGVLIVIDHEDAPSSLHHSRRRFRPFPRRRLDSRERGDADHELTAAPRPLAGRGHGAAMKGDEALHQGETQPKPALGTRERLPALHEEIEDMRKEVGADPFSVIPNANDGLSALPRGAEPYVASRGRELRGVGQEIGDDLSEPKRVRTHGQAGRRHRHLQVLLALLDKRAGHLHSLG